MLVLSRKPGEEIIIAGEIRVKIVSVQGERVRLGVTAPDDVAVDRREVHDRRVGEGFAEIAQPTIEAEAA
jgi:carbon storage regulator